MATYEQLKSALIKADAAGNVEDAKALADAIRGLQAPPSAAAASQANGIPTARQPDFAQTSPNLYRGLVTAREMAGPTIEALGTAGGALAGSALGPPGMVGGAGLGYGISKELLNLADVGLGLKPPRTSTQTIVDPAQNVAEGAFFEGVAGPVVKGAAKVFDIGKGATLKAKNILKETLSGVDIPSVRNMLTKQGDVTAGQALGDSTLPAFQALSERVSARTVPAAKFKFETQEAQEAARLAGIKDITPDLAQSIKTRELVSKPFYEAADKAIVPLDAPMISLFDRIPKGTLEKAAEIAKMEGRPFILNDPQTGQAFPEVTGETLHYIKRALSDVANAPASAQGIGRDTQAAARGVLNDFVKEFEMRVPDYAAARSTFADLSRPVNQAKVLDAMMKVLEQPGGGERVMPFLNVLGRGETALLKKSTGFPRYEAGDLRKVLTPDQMKAVDDAASQMTRDIRISEQAATGREALFDVLSDNMGMLRLPSLISFKVAIANDMLNKVEKKVGRKVMNTLTDSLKTAKTAEELLSVLPAHERLRVLNIVYDTAANSKTAQRAIRTGVKEAATQEEPNKLAPPKLYQNRNMLAQ
jgi:hypothetical protein